MDIGLPVVLPGDNPRKTVTQMDSREPSMDTSNTHIHQQHIAAAQRVPCRHRRKTKVDRRR